MMNERDLYPAGRLSAPIEPSSVDLGDERSHRPRYELIGQLRLIREAGLDSLRATEQFDPDVSLKLSQCSSMDEVDAFLDIWRQTRVDGLDRVKKDLRSACASAIDGPPNRDQESGSAS